MFVCVRVFVACPPPVTLSLYLRRLDWHFAGLKRLPGGTLESSGVGAQGPQADTLHRYVPCPTLLISGSPWGLVGLKLTRVLEGSFGGEDQVQGHVGARLSSLVLV
jgi:hypothetical protein